MPPLSGPDEGIEYTDIPKRAARYGARFPEFPTPDRNEPAKDRKQINIGKKTYECIELWFKGGNGGTLKELCERAIRTYLMIHTNLVGEGKEVRLKRSDTAQQLQALVGRVDRYVSAKGSDSVKEAHVIRIGTHLAVSLLDADGVLNAEDDLYHELFQMAHQNGRLIGDEVVARIRLAGLLLRLCPEAAGLRLGAEADGASTEELRAVLKACLSRAQGR